MLSVPLNHGNVALIDDEDADLVLCHTWWITRKGYAFTTLRENGKGKTREMHRLIMNPPASMQVDHINGNRLDNQKANLRIVTQEQNHQNYRGARSDSSTGIRGVFPHKKSGYSVRLWLNGRSKSFGCYRTIEEAEQVAKQARREMFTHSSENAP